MSDETTIKYIVAISARLFSVHFILEYSIYLFALIQPYPKHKVAGETGIEPAAYGFGDRRSTN